jgi:hypothetical protein
VFLQGTKDGGRPRSAVVIGRVLCWGLAVHQFWNVGKVLDESKRLSLGVVREPKFGLEVRSATSLSSVSPQIASFPPPGKRAPPHVQFPPPLEFDDEAIVDFSRDEPGGQSVRATSVSEQQLGKSSISECVW